MTINYKCLGHNDKMRVRRYYVLTYFLKGATPQEIAQFTEENPKLKPITIKQVYNDIGYLRTHPLHDLPVDIVKDFGKSFYEMKVTELERKLKKHEENPSVWLGIQKLIKDYKDASLKLQGASVEKVEHTGDVGFVLKWKENEGNNDPVPAAPQTKPLSPI